MSKLITVTLNPALDLATSVDVVLPDHKLRCQPPVREPGGGGINVARVATRLGVDALAVVVAGGATGNQLLALVSDEAIAVARVDVEAETRESLTVSERSTGRQYRFVLPGPSIDASVLHRVTQVLKAEASVQVMVISGSMPPGTPAGSIATLIEDLSAVDVIVDTSGPELRRALQAPVAVVKPSARELASVVDRELRTEADVLLAAEEVMAASKVEALLVSIGPGGAILLTRSGPTRRVRPPTVQVRSAVGAGDSMVGGLAAGLCRGMDLISATSLGVAAGTAAVMTPGSGLCTAAAIDEVLPLVTVE